MQTQFTILMNSLPYRRGQASGNVVSVPRHGCETKLFRLIFRSVSDHGILTEWEGSVSLSTIDLLIKLACFVITVNII
jgi:hypothetical protein